MVRAAQHGPLGTARLAVKTQLSTMERVLPLHYAVNNDGYARSFLMDSSE